MIDSLMLLTDDFIKYKHSNGYMYVTAEYYLKKYVAFSSVTAPVEVIPSKETINAFLGLSNKTPGSLYNIASALREFCRYLEKIRGKNQRDRYRDLYLQYRIIANTCNPCNLSY